MTKLIFSVILAVGLSFMPHFDIPAAPKRPSGGIEWRTLTEATLLARTLNKKILVSVYTDWCGYCRLMEKRTYSDPAVQAYIEQKYIAVRLNAETKETLYFLDNQFKYLPDKKVNDLAYVLLDGKMQYPTSVFMTKDAEVLSPVQGNIDPEMMLRILKYYGEDIYLKTKWEDYKKN